MIFNVPRSVVMEGGSTLESNMSLSLVGSGIAQSPVEPQEPGVCVFSLKMPCVSQCVQVW